MIKIIPYSTANSSFLKSLNVEWLQKYFVVEPMDILQLSNPQKEILDKGGYIYFAAYNGTIVGTASLLKVNDEEYELAKMAVTETCKGMGIGKLLMDYCLNKAKDLKATKVSLYSNTKLKPAIHIYRSYGFIEVPLPFEVHYERANIKMEKNMLSNV